AIRNGRLELLPPSHPYDAVMSSVVGGRLVASNSLVMLLTVIGATPKVEHRRYFTTFHHGACEAASNPVVPFQGADVRPLRLDRWIVHDDGGLERVPVARASSPNEFASYCESITRVLHDIAANATSPLRSRAFGLTTTLSTGYDSCAIAALARDAGWKQGFT